MNQGIKKILLATDGSDYSVGALQVAIELTKRCQGELHIMSIMLTTHDLENVGTQNMRAEREKVVQDRLDRAAEAAIGQSVASTLHLVYGQEPQHEIVSTAEEIKADLVVLGRRGTRGLSRFSVGHATAYVAGHAPCNVLVVPRAAKVWHQRIILATDGSATSEAAAATAQAVAGQCGLPVSVVSATTSSHSSERKADAQAAVDRVLGNMKAVGLSCEGEVVSGRPDEIVIEATASKGGDLIVVGSHGRTGLSRLFLGSISERIIGQAQCPVLVARHAG